MSASSHKSSPLPAEASRTRSVLCCNAAHCRSPRSGEVEFTDLCVDQGVVAECDALSDDVAVDEERHRGAEYAKGFVFKVMETYSETFAAKVTDGGLNASFAISRRELDQVGNIEERIGSESRRADLHSMR